MDREGLLSQVARAGGDEPLTDALAKWTRGDLHLTKGAAAELSRYEQATASSILTRLIIDRVVPMTDAEQKQLGHTGTTRRMERMTNKRNRRIDHYMHTVSRRLIDLLVKEGIGVLVIGKNDAWKQQAQMSKRTNQNFVVGPGPVASP